ncbi:TPA: hypothetical protein ACVOYR_000452 [Vibrio alginolyticus]
MSDYPDYYPDDMPPKDAIAASGTAFRLVNSNPPVKTCFSSTLEENPGRKAKKPTDREMLYGSSLFTQKKEALKKKKLFKPLRQKLLSTGALIEDDGVMKETGGHHHVTVWFKTDSEPHTRFECIEE